VFQSDEVVEEVMEEKYQGELLDSFTFEELDGK